MISQRFWHLVLLHHRAVPWRWKMAFTFGVGILLVEFLVLFLPPLPRLPYFLQYVHIFFTRIFVWEFPALVVFMTLPVTMLIGRSADVGGKTFAFSLPYSRGEYVFSRLVYGFFPSGILSLFLFFALVVLNALDPVSVDITFFYEVPPLLVAMFSLLLLWAFYVTYFWLSSVVSSNLTALAFTLGLTFIILFFSFSIPFALFPRDFLVFTCLILFLFFLFGILMAYYVNTQRDVEQEGI